MEQPYQICTELVLDTTYPDITFDTQGRCSEYVEFETKIRPRWNVDADAYDKFGAIADSIRKAGKGREFDCLLGLSGGLDSSYMLHTVVKEFGLRPLVFHVDGGWNTEVSVHNINVLVDKLKLDLYTEVINWEEMKDLQLAFFKSGVPHIDVPQDHAFIAVLYRFAQKYGIKSILNGGNISTECVRTPLEYFYWGTDMRQIRDIISRFGTVPLRTYPFSSIYYHKLYLRYLRGVRVVKPLNLLPYTKAEAELVLEREYGWKAYGQKHFESRFTRFYEGYWLPTRFNFDIRCVQFSSLILSGQMTRDEALEQLEQPPYDSKLIQQDFDYVAGKLGITSDELRGYHEMSKKYYRDYRNQHRILELGERLLTALGGTRRGGAS